MAEAVAEAQSAAPEKNVELNGSAAKDTDTATKTHSGEKLNGDAQADEEDDYERYDDKRSDRKKRNRDDDDRDRSRSPSRDRRRRDDRRGGGRGRGGGFRGGRAGRGGRGGRGGFNYHKKDNVRTRFEREEESSDASEMRRQVEFYFSDSNLPTDKYLFTETGGPANKPFPLKNIHSFKRMRHFQPFSALVEAVKSSDFLDVNDKDEVYRKVPLDSKFTDDFQKNAELLTSDSMLRSIYAKGFGEEKETTAFDIEQLFSPFNVRSVRLRRHNDGAFKGSVFVEFADEEGAQQFLTMEEKPTWNDTELQIMSKKAYVDMKNEAIREGTVIPRSASDYQRNGHRHHRDRRGSFNGGYNKRKRHDRDEDDVNQDDWRERRDRFQKSRRGDEERDDRRRARDKSRSRSRSRSRSPYRGHKDEVDSTGPTTEGAREDKREEASTEETKAADAKVDEASA